MRKKWILITGICISFVLITTVLSVLVFQLRHKHQLGDAKVYHIYNDHISYTRQCIKDGYTQSFESEATFAEVIANLGSGDKIVVEEDIVSSQIFKIDSSSAQGSVIGKDVVVDIDLNNKKINSMFDLNASYGDIKFNISNGTINSTYLNTIKASGVHGSIEININNVKCLSVGAKNAPLYIENAYKISVNAIDSKFISQNNPFPYSDYGVGVFINNEGNFTFENCLMEGGDGLHVRNGSVSLKSCSLVNTGLVTQAYQSVSTGFSAVGASLAAHCYTSDVGTTNFEITVENCVMLTNNSNRVIYVYRVAKSGCEAVVNPDSYIKIKSCKFSQNPEEFYNLDKVVYEGSSRLMNNGQGYWVYGSVTK